MYEKRLDNWKSFIEAADKSDVGNHPNKAYAFRGHSNVDWNLQTSIMRHLPSANLTEQKALQLEQIALAEFRSQAHLHVLPSILSSTNDTLSWWTLMQHHGSPTRLLDWTASIYVALYFAVIDHFDKDGVIWLVHIASLDEKMKLLDDHSELPETESAIKNEFLKTNEPHVLMFVNRITQSDRMIVQQGGFSICRNVLGDHGSILSDSLGGDSNFVQFGKLIVPAEQKIPFLRKLRSMNITANSLFPGIDGLGRSVAELLKLGLG